MAVPFAVLFHATDAQVYLCGFTDSEAVPADPAAVAVDAAACASLTRIATTVSSTLASDYHTAASQACYLPTSSDDLPLIGKLPDCHGLYIATAHSCWGILNSTGTALALSQLIIDGEAACVDLAAFDPARFTAGSGGAAAGAGRQRIAEEEAGDDDE